MNKFNLDLHKKEVFIVKKLFSILIVLIAMFMVASVVGAKGKDRNKFDDPEKVEWALKKVEKATEKYKDVNKAIRDGYAPFGPYVPRMGYHYSREFDPDGKVDALSPEVLVYAEGKNGKLRLVAVEYLSTTPNSLFGKEFDEPHGIPWYSLHAWIYSYNPDGIFTGMNPRID